MNAKLGILITIASLTLGCAAEYDESDIFNSDEEILAFDHGDLWTMATATPVDGSHYALAQYRRGIAFYIDTTATPGNAYTTWVCGFNNPSACAGGDVMLTPQCSLTDLFATGDHDAFCQQGDGVVAESDGRLVMWGNQNTTEVAIGKGLSNYDGSEIVFVLRDHGPALSGADLDAQLETFAGGCDINTCADEQVSMSMAH